jgi:PhnB protein
MNTNLHLGFKGDCDAAFSFYETVFRSKRVFTMTYGDAPPDVQTSAESKDLIMHTAMQLGSLTLMGADAPPGRGQAFGGFEISIDDPDEAEVRRLFTALSEGGRVTMPLGPTFWTPLFGMCTDKFGVSWMISIPGPQS